MKLIIDISKNKYNDIVEQVKKCDYPDMGLGKIIANGKPLPQGCNDLISREYLKENAETVTLWNGDVRRFVSYETIDNAPTVPLPDFKEGYKQAIIDGKTNFSKLQGEWIDDNSTNYYYANCNKCGYQIDVHENCGYHNFCPNCGADMRTKNKRMSEEEYLQNVGRLYTDEGYLEDEKADKGGRK